jgi:hypothetical protein
MRWIMRENPKANPELCAKLFYEEAKTIASLPRQRCWQLRPPSVKMWYASSKPGSGN